MKKVLLFLISISFIAIPNAVFAAGVYCANENLREYRKELNKIEYEYDITYDNVDNKDKDGVPVDYINLSVNGLPDDFTVILASKNGEQYNLSLQKPKISGGVTLIHFYYSKCMNNPIKTEEIFLPYYNKSSSNPFDDGSIINTMPSKHKIFITIGLSAATIGLFVLAIFILKKGRKK